MDIALSALTLGIVLTGFYAVMRKPEPIPVRIRSRAGRRSRHH